LRERGWEQWQCPNSDKGAKCGTLGIYVLCGVYHKINYSSMKAAIMEFIEMNNKKDDN
jgi:hypothetical protein